MRITLVLSLIILVSLGFQNCVGTVPVKFVAMQKSPLSSSMAEGGGLYDGKPENGYYCRVYDNMSCQSQVNNLQSIVKVDNSGLHLLEDNCASTSSTFLVGDAGVGFTSLAPNFIGITRGIFKRCEVGVDNLPPAPTEMTDAVCNSKQNDVVVIITKNILSKNMDFNLNFRDTTGIRSVTNQSVTKIISSTGSRYFSDTQDFNLTIDRSSSQTSQGHLQVVVDQNSLSLDLTCRQANLDPTIIIEKDMELSSTWMDTNRLVGYWKLNEINAVQGVGIIDSSSFATSGVLDTGNDGQIKSNSSVLGGTLGFDGVNDFIRIARPQDGHLDFGMRSFSYMVWIKKTGNAGTWDMPIFHGGSNSAGFNIECGASKVGCYATISDGQNLSSSEVYARFSNSSSSLIGGWFLLTAVVDRSSHQFRAYLNGVLVSAVDIVNIGSVDSNLNLHIGAGEINSRMGYPFLGFIDDVAIWDRALADTEILEIFQRLRPKFY